MKIGNKMVHGEATCKPNSPTHYNPNFEKNLHLLSYGIP
jgi:hypothetical protein